jgi:hypothetical protein
MTNGGTESTDEEEEEKNNNEILPQIGEDPGPSADVMEKDSKRKDRGAHKRNKDIDLRKSKE